MYKRLHLQNFNAYVPNRYACGVIVELRENREGSRCSAGWLSEHDIAHSASVGVR